MIPTIASICIIVFSYTLIGLELRYNHHLNCLYHIGLTLIILDHPVLAIPFALQIPNRHVRHSHSRQRTTAPPPYERADTESPTIDPVPEPETPGGVRFEPRTHEDTGTL